MVFKLATSTRNRVKDTLHCRDVHVHFKWAKSEWPPVRFKISNDCSKKRLECIGKERNAQPQVRLQGRKKIRGKMVTSLVHIHSAVAWHKDECSFRYKHWNEQIRFPVKGL